MGEWGWGGTEGRPLFSSWGCFFSFPRPGFAPVSQLGRTRGVCASGLPAPCLVLLVGDARYEAALQLSPLAGREENSSVAT